MRRLFPKSLVGQTILILTLGLLVSHLLSMLIYSHDRFNTLDEVMVNSATQRIANTAHILSQTPISEREKIANAYENPAFRVWLSPTEMFVETNNENKYKDWIRTYLLDQLHDQNTKEINVQIINILGNAEIAMIDPGELYLKRLLYAIEGVGLERVLRVSIKLGEEQWVNMSTTIPKISNFWSSVSAVSVALMALAIILLSFFAVKRMTSPLRLFAIAARRLGRNVDAPYLEENGPDEILDVVKSFNEMHSQLKQMIENRTVMLAAISHDLRTPIALLRLRVESSDESDDRTKMLNNLDHMERIIASSLSFARQDAHIEITEKVDLRALVESICNDYIDVGSNVALGNCEKMLLECQPTAIKRAITNIIDNALKYASSCTVSLSQSEGIAIIKILDNGDGIPGDQIDQVFQPFFRCENSRNSETGGIGLGLTIAKSILDAHGGSVSLRNENTGGLCVSLYIPI